MNDKIMRYSEIAMNFKERRAFLVEHEGLYTPERWNIVNARLAHDMQVFKIARAKQLGVVK